MRRPLRLLPLAATLGVLLAPSPAAAERRTETFRYPISVAPYQVKQQFTLAPKPNVDGFITGMRTDVVDEDGTPVPIQRLMLHHIVFSTLGRQDSTCTQFTGLDNLGRFPMRADRFYGAGEERAQLVLPPGYGYRMEADDRWGMTWMIMNHRHRPDRAFVEYTVTYETGTSNMTEVTPYWLDVRNCRADPVYDVPGGGRRGSTHTESMNWTVPRSGRIVAGGGHVHGGARNLTLRNRSCQNRRLYTSEPLWGSARHPFYNVQPILHEPGPISMSGFNSRQGIPVAAGQRVRLDSNYDAELPHTRVMGIMVVYMAHDDAVSGCRDLPGDVISAQTHTEPGARRRAPRFRVPITGIGPNGIARTIQRPPGRTVRLGSGATVDARNFSFSRPNIELRQGATLRWRFLGEGIDGLHNVTLANGPRGFSSPNLNGGRVYRQRFTRAGTYQLFCGLHPVSMTQTVTVRPRRRG